MDLWVFDVTECLDNFLCFSRSSRTSPVRKRSVLYFSVGLSRTVRAFVSLTRYNIIEQNINAFLETPRPNAIQTASYCCFGKISDQTISKLSFIGLSTRPNKIDQSENKEKERLSKEIGHKIKKTANSDDLLGNMQLKLSFYDWCISILSSKKCQTPIILADLLGNESLRRPVQKVIVCNLWLVDFDPFVSFCVSRFVACDLSVAKTRR